MQSVPLSTRKLVWFPSSSLDKNVEEREGGRVRANGPPFLVAQEFRLILARS